MRYSIWCLEKSTSLSSDESLDELWTSSIINRPLSATKFLTNTSPLGISFIQLACPLIHTGQGPVSIQYKQFWNLSSTKHGSLDRAALVVQRLPILVSHIERRIRFGMQVKQSFWRVQSEILKSRLRVCRFTNFPVKLSFRKWEDLIFKTWHCNPLLERSLVKKHKLAKSTLPLNKLSGHIQLFCIYKLPVNLN